MDVCVTGTAVLGLLPRHHSARLDPVIVKKTFRLKFSPDPILKLAGRYRYANDDVALAAGRQIRNGQFTRQHSPRSSNGRPGAEDAAGCGATPMQRSRTRCWSRSAPRRATGDRCSGRAGGRRRAGRLRRPYSKLPGALHGDRLPRWRRSELNARGARWISTLTISRPAPARQQTPGQFARSGSRPLAMVERASRSVPAVRGTVPIGLRKPIFADMCPSIQACSSRREKIGSSQLSPANAP